MNGRRLPDGYHYRDAQPGDYWKQSYRSKDEKTDFSEAKRGIDWEWNIKDPLGVVGALGKHQVEEHVYGTITVTPSIWDAPSGYHGWLRSGVWTQA